MLGKHAAPHVAAICAQARRVGLLASAAARAARPLSYGGSGACRSGCPEAVHAARWRSTAATLPAGDATSRWSARFGRDLPERAAISQHWRRGGGPWTGGGE